MEQKFAYRTTLLTFDPNPSDINQASKRIRCLPSNPGRIGSKWQGSVRPTVRAGRGPVKRTEVGGRKQSARAVAFNAYAKRSKIFMK